MATRIVENTTYNKGGYREIFDVDNRENKLKVYIKSKLKVYDVTLVGKATIEREEFCASKFTFTVLKDSVVSFNQGDAVSVKFENTGMFFGYVFSKARDKEGLIEVVCYDQMRYLKNRRTYTRASMTLDEVVAKIGADCSLAMGECDQSKVLLSPVAADNVSLLDVVTKACKDTRRLSGERFVVYDDYGKLVLKKEDKLDVGLVIDSTQAEDFVYRDTIDKDTYNVIELYSDTKRKNLRELTVVSDKETMSAWGSLILSKKATAPENAYREAQNLLSEYNRINRQIVIKTVKGDMRFTPGGWVYVQLTMGDLTFDGYVRIVKAVHKFENNGYCVDLYLDGSELE